MALTPSEQTFKHGQNDEFLTGTETGLNSHICLTSHHVKSPDQSINNVSDISYRLIRAQSQAQIDPKDAMVLNMKQEIDRLKKDKFNREDEIQTTRQEMDRLRADMRKNQQTIDALIDKKSIESGRKSRRSQNNIPRSPRDSKRSSSGRKKSRRLSSSQKKSSRWDQYDSKDLVTSKYDSKISMGSKGSKDTQLQSRHVQADSRSFRNTIKIGETNQLRGSKKGMGSIRSPNTHTYGYKGNK